MKINTVLLSPVYRHANYSRGPLEFSDGYRRHLNEAVRQRYTYSPYYYSLFLKYKDTLVPPIVPMSYYFDTKSKRRTIFNVVDQFMIGEAMLAAPIVKPGR
jgi:alpha-glucosidase (family GH31 glycosyl hydrolase)